MSIILPTLEASVVAICDANNRIVGTGFVASAQLIITCAHVVEQAGGGPGDAINVRFHANGLHQTARLMSEYWRDADAEDLAVLRMTNDLPVDVVPLPLGMASGSDRHAFRSLGYPDVGDYVGLVADGTINATIRKADGREMVQLTSSQLAQGHSGAPVWDEVRRTVIGIVSEVYHSGEDSKNRDTAFATPAQTLWQICPELRDAVPSQPRYERPVDDPLAASALGGDSIQSIKVQFQRQTIVNLRQITSIIPGMSKPLPRRETSVIEEQWHMSQGIVLTGKAGTGKSGIVSMLVNAAQAMGKISLLIDARRLGHIRTDADLRSYLDLTSPVSIAVSQVGAYRGCRVIIDQLDNVVGSPVATVLEDFAIECCQIGDGIQVLVVCRNQIPQESKFVERLMNGGFVEIISYEISDDLVEEAFNSIGISGHSRNLVEMGRNLLNLEIIGSIRRQKPDFDFSTFAGGNELYLWEAYLTLLQDREMDSLGPNVLAEAVVLARRGLNSANGVFSVEFPIPLPVQRLASWGIIGQLEGRAHRFRHDKLQDYIYAWDATERLAKPHDVLNEILPYKSPNVLKWMDVIYQRRNSVVRKEFLREMFDVSG